MPTLLQELLHDLRHETFLLLKKPAFTATTILILALAIGANTAIFSILDPLLLRELPVQSPSQLVSVQYRGSLGSETFSPYAALQRYRDAGPAFSGFLAFANPKTLPMAFGSGSASVHVLPVTPNYFTLLGIRPALGRLLLPADDPRTSHAAAPVAVLSFSAWQKYFGSDPSILGGSIQLGPTLYTLVGITPPNFFGLEVGYSPDFYVPITPSAAAFIDDEGWVKIFGRLNPGVSLVQAQGALQPLLPDIASNALPAVEISQDMASLVLVPASRGLSDLREQFSLPAKILMGIVALVLLIACSNVANLLLAQGIGRQREMSVRSALGASRARLVRQLLTQSLVLVAAGGLAGILMGNWASALLIRSFSTSNSTIALNSGLNLRVALFAIIILSVTVLLAGLVPSLLATRSSVGRDLQTQTATAAKSAAFSRLAQAFLVTQVALSVALLCAATLLARSLRNLETFNAGFDRDHILVLTLNSRDPSANFWSVYSESAVNRILGRVQSLQVVRSASLSTISPISNREAGINVSPYPQLSSPSTVFNAEFNTVSPRYLETLGIPLLFGRDFTVEDASHRPARAAIINVAMARRLFGDRNALGNNIGKQFQTIEGRFPLLQIVGIVANSKYNDLREKDREFFYLPGTGPTLEVRVAGNPAPLIPQLRELVSAIDPAITVSSAATLRHQVDESLRHDQIVSALCGCFSFLALLLTCAGLFGTLSFNVASRTAEIGLRRALGAQPRQIFILIVGQGIELTVLGLLLGSLLIYFSASLLASLLFGVQPHDLLTYALSFFILLLAAFFASYLPARRASLLDPALALRHS